MTPLMKINKTLNPQKIIEIPKYFMVLFLIATYIVCGKEY